EEGVLKLRLEKGRPFNGRTIMKVDACIREVFIQTQITHFVELLSEMGIGDKNHQQRSKSEVILQDNGTGVEKNESKSKPPIKKSHRTKRKPPIKVDKKVSGNKGGDDDNKKSGNDRMNKIEIGDMLGLDGNNGNDRRMDRSGARPVPMMAIRENNGNDRRIDRSGAHPVPMTATSPIELQDNGIFPKIKLNKTP
ncbi:MAG: hypothetical protein GY755_23355, partial [Chloroflexi bacterium]|nr:hypothetical protein [Chloroflexota bacterium]